MEWQFLAAPITLPFQDPSHLRFHTLVYYRLTVLAALHICTESRNHIQKADISARVCKLLYIPHPTRDVTKFIYIVLIDNQSASRSPTIPPLPRDASTLTFDISSCLTMRAKKTSSSRTSQPQKCFQTYSRKPSALTYSAASPRTSESPPLRPQHTALPNDRTDAAISHVDKLLSTDAYFQRVRTCPYNARFSVCL